MRFSLKWLSIVLALGSASSLWADDLALVKLSDQGQVETATRLFDHAYARSGDRFLVAISGTLRDSLASNGLSFEIVLRDVSLRSACLVMPTNRGKMAGLEVKSLGGGVSLEAGVSLQERASVAASAAQERGEVFVVPLIGKNIPFQYRVEAAPHLFAPTDLFPTDSVVNLISQDTITAINKRLEAFRTRHIYADSNRAAREWIISKFASWGYTQISTPEFSYYGFLCKNIKVIKPGYAEPDKVIVIGGHYDSYNTQSDPSVFAPGSDDNGSGTTLTMELARVLANVPLRKTIIFMPFSAEEQGLVGSDSAARSFRAAGTDIEVMMNYDMVGYTLDSYWDFSLSSGLNPAYALLSSQTATRLTSLIPKIVGMGGSSDHYSFFEQGYDIVDDIESDFNTPGWHTNIDLTSRMNFDYMTQVVKMAAASAAIVANAGSPSAIAPITDVGNGTDLDITISGCNPNYQYWLYWGTSSGVFTDSAAVPYGLCSYRVTGLTEGQRYYFGAYGKPSGGYRAIWSGGASEMPLVVPRSPQNVIADPAERKILLDWKDNIEGDLAFYRVYRRLEGEPTFDLLAEGITNSSYVDSVVISGVKYLYKLTAVDLSGHESPRSQEVGTYPATFDGGILVVDEFTQDYEYMATQEHQAAYFDTVLGFLHHDLVRVDSLGQTLEKGVVGRYSSVVWDDDDFFNKQIAASSSILDWYLTHNVNMLVCGMKTVQTWSQTPVNPAITLSREFMISGYYADNFEIFNGAVGANGWPSVEWGGVSRGLRYGTDIPVLTVRPGGTVIMTYDAYDDDPAFEGKPCGVAYSGPNGKRVLLSFPLYYLSASSAAALMNKVKEYFGETTFTIPPGDVNHSGLADLADLSTIIAYLTGVLPTLADKNAGDVNHTCLIDVADLSAMVSYLSTGHPTLQAGCVTP